MREIEVHYDLYEWPQPRRDDEASLLVDYLCRLLSRKAKRENVEIVRRPWLSRQRYVDGSTRYFLKAEVVPLTQHPPKDETP